VDRLLRSRRFVILLILIAPLVALHIVHAPRRGPFSNDPSYYMQTARHVADGDGLLTSVSLYHEGLHPLPQPYFDYPLWPLLLGAAAKAIGLIAAANVLPQAFFIVDLVLFYLLANRLAGDTGTMTFRGETLDIGHLAALLAGTNFVFFSSTALPYTEGLAFALAVGSFVTLERPAWSGVLAGLAVLARFQMVLVPVVTAFVLLIFAVRSRRFRSFVVYTVTSGVVYGTWAAYLHAAGPRRAGIPRFGEWVPADSVAQQLLHVAKGLVVALTPGHDGSLFHSFGPVVLVVLIAIVWCAREQANAVLLAAVGLTGIASMVVLANFESVRPPFWMFGSRHSAPFLFAVIAAMVIMVRAPRSARAIAALLVVASIAHGTAAIARDPIPAGNGLTGAEAAMAQWLRTQHPTATLLTSNAQALSVYTPNKFHWTTCDVLPEKTRLMLDKLSIDFVIVYDGERTCAFAQGLDDRLVPEIVFRDEVRSIQVFRVTRKISSTGAPSLLHDAAG
jgi:hypothetical protein